MANQRRNVAKETVRWTSGTNIIAGGWLVLAPFALQYTSDVGVSTLGGIHPSVWNDIIVGLVVLSLAAVSAIASRGVSPERGGNPPER